MSISEFRRNVRPGPEFNEFYNNYWSQEGVAPITVITNKIIEAGNQGLRTISAKYEDLDMSPRVLEVIKSEGRNDAAAIIFGVTMQTLLKVPFNSEFDEFEYRTNINNKFANTLYPEFEIDQESHPVVKIPPTVARQMSDVLIKERNPIAFFELNQRHLIPSEMMRFLRDEGFTDILYRFDWFEKLVDSVI